jgi:hypothetical protein
MNFRFFLLWLSHRVRFPYEGKRAASAHTNSCVFFSFNIGCANILHTYHIYFHGHAFFSRKQTMTGALICSISRVESVQNVRATGFPFLPANKSLLVMHRKILH